MAEKETHQGQGGDDMNRNSEEQARAHEARRDRRMSICVVIVGIVLAFVLVWIWR